MKFIENRVLIEANLVCAFARADKILNDEESSREDLLQSRAFLMEMFGKLERITAGLQDRDEGRDSHGITQRDSDGSGQPRASPMLTAIMSGGVGISGRELYKYR